MKLSSIVFMLLAFCFFAFAGEDIEALRKAAESGDVKAQYKLGLAYYFGQDGVKDVDEAFKWFKKAKENGYEPENN